MQCYNFLNWLENGIFFCYVFQNATILLFNFHGGGHPQNLGYMGRGAGAGEEFEEGDEGLSIKYHKLPSNPIQNEQSLMSKSS